MLTRQRTTGTSPQPPAVPVKRQAEPSLDGLPVVKRKRGRPPKARPTISEPEEQTPHPAETAVPLSRETPADTDNVTVEPPKSPLPVRRSAGRQPRQAVISRNRGRKLDRKVLKATITSDSVTSPPSTAAVVAEAVSVADAVETEAEKRGIVPVRSRSRTRERPRGDAAVTGKYKKKFPRVAGAGSNEEPNICTRCDNRKANLMHFFALHNGLLAEEQKTFDVHEKRKRWGTTINHKKCKLRCQEATCGKILNSVTAMIYHEKICNVDVQKVPCPECGRFISSITLAQHLRGHGKVAAELDRWKHDSTLVGETESRDPSEEPPKVANDTVTDSDLPDGRRKRNSALAARKKFLSAEKELDELEDGDSDSLKYEPSRSATSTTGDEDDEKIDDISADEAGEASTSRSPAKTAGNSTSQAAVKLARLKALWTRSLDVLGYARCETDGCDHMAGTMPDIVSHSHYCRLKVRQSSHIYRCKIEGRYCKFRADNDANLFRHYVKRHKMDVGEARIKSKIVADTKSEPPWMPSRAEIDALQLFD